MGGRGDNEEDGEDGEDGEELEEGKPRAAVAAKGPSLSLTKVEQLSSWLSAQCGFEPATAAKYAATLEGEGVDRPSDLADLDDGDWPSSIKPLHLKKLKAAAANI